MSRPTVYVASVSGGKDSTAMSLWLTEQGIEHRRVFFDTGWEHADTYAYLDYLGERLGPIERRCREPVLDERREAMALELEAALGFRSAMVRWTLHKASFPSRERRWCTQALKMETARDVMREAVAAGAAPVNVLGIRAAESTARAKLLERELDEDLDAMVWRPLLAWSVEDVIAVHQRHDVRPNPLYLRNAERVGCWPCVMAGKPEIKLLGEDRIAALARLEAMVALLARERRIARGEPTLARAPTWFQGHRRDGLAWSCVACRGVGTGGGIGPAHVGCATCGGRGEHLTIPTIPIRRMVEWSRTSRGGAQMAMPLPDDSGCMRWGLCDLPAGDR